MTIIDHSQATQNIPPTHTQKISSTNGYLCITLAHPLVLVLSSITGKTITQHTATYALNILHSDRAILAPFATHKITPQ